MIKSREYIDYLGKIMFVILFFVFIGAFSNNHVKSIHHSAIPQNVILETRSNTIAVNIEAPPPSYQKSFVSLIDKLNIKFFNTNFKVLAHNKLVQQSIIVIQKGALLIKPIVLSRFYSPHLFIDTEELPILS
jgi:hypothetical protein